MALDHAIETVVRRDRGVIVASLVGVVALAWAYLFWEASRMGGMDVGVTRAGATSERFAATFLMWAVMMVGMMLPSAAPAILLYGGIARRSREQGRTVPAIYTFVAGYLIAWTVFSVLAAALQVLLGHLVLMSPMMVSTSTVLSGVFLLAAGVYQLLPVKDACLGTCRAPLQFFSKRWRSGRIGALRMGLEHGFICVGCCWALMLLLFAGGVMNLLWVAVIAGFILVEKLMPGGRLAGRFAGIGLVAMGLLARLGVFERVPTLTMYLAQTREVLAAGPYARPPLERTMSKRSPPT